MFFAQRMGEKMRLTLVKTLTVGAIVIGAAMVAHAQQIGLVAQDFDTGKDEYGAHCAVCHGLSGKGDGPFVQAFKSGIVVPNLTELSKKNNGVFPFRRVHETIDAIQGLTAHGTQQTPIWG